MTRLNDSKAENRINNLCAKFKVQYPHLYGTSGSRYIRKLIRNLFEYSDYPETSMARQG